MKELKQSDLNSLKKGDTINHFLIIKKCELRQTKSNKNFLSLELGDKTASLSANLWDDYDNIFGTIKTGDIAKIKGTIDEYQGNPQIKISSLKIAPPSEGISPQDFLAKSKRNVNVMKDEFLNRIENIGNAYLKQLIKNIFNEENLDKFSLAPAGKQWHHSYIHGLIEHTLEIIRICDLMCDIHHEINRDLLICGAMMHDFGKVYELNYETSFDYTDKGKLIGHIVLSAMFIKEEINKIPSFPEELKNSLLHIVLSHQGKLEYASPVVPKTLEAITLYQADELSAKVNAYKNALASEIKTDGKWTKFISLASTDLYNHGITQSEEENNTNKTLFD